MPILGTDNKFGDLIIKFKVIMPDSMSTENLELLNTIFPKINNIKELEDNEIHTLEIATESDFEYSDDDDDNSESEYSDESEYDDDDSEKQTDDEESQDGEENKDITVVDLKKTKSKSSKVI